MASSRPVFIARSMEGWWALSMSTRGTLNAWYVRAFTQGNGLPWNPAKHSSFVSVRIGCLPWGLRLTVSRLPTEHLYCSSEASWMSICYPMTVDKHTIKPTTVRLEPQDRQAIETIKQLYGCPSDVAAIRLAIRMAARQEFPPAGGGLSPPCLEGRGPQAALG